MATATVEPTAGKPMTLTSTSTKRWGIGPPDRRDSEGKVTGKPGPMVRFDTPADAIIPDKLRIGQTKTITDPKTVAFLKQPVIKKLLEREGFRVSGG